MHTHTRNHAMNFENDKHQFSEEAYLFFIITRRIRITFDRKTIQMRHFVQN